MIGVVLVVGSVLWTLFMLEGAKTFGYLEGYVDGSLESRGAPSTFGEPFGILFLRRLGIIRGRGPYKGEHRRGDV